VLLAAAFVSYAGPFNMFFRTQLVDESWLPDLLQRGIPSTQGIRPLDLLTDDTRKAKWANEGLPIDPLSVENGAIMTNSARWALMIDPQLQVGGWEGLGGGGVRIWCVDQLKAFQLACVSAGVLVYAGDTLTASYAAVAAPTGDVKQSECGVQYHT
jgi:hypothetical protein